MSDATNKTTRLSPAQAALLRCVVSTNGGGVHAGWNEGQQITRQLRTLERKGLVQGKAGSVGWAVHTREGLEWVRANPEMSEA